MDLLKSRDSNYVHDFINLMYFFSLFPLITKPSRVSENTATLIDHIWTTQVELNINNLRIHTDTTDHFPIVSHFNFQTPKSTPHYINKRILTNVALENFSNDLAHVDWSHILEPSCPKESYNLFYSNFDTLFQKHFPVKQIRINKISQQKTYIALAVKKSIKEKHRF